MTRTRFGALALATLLLAGVAIAQQRPVSTPPAAQQAGIPRRGDSSQAALTPAREEGVAPPTILREVYAYERAGRRDPFASLLSTSDLRPGLHELRLTGVLVHPTRPIAVMRDGEGTQYRVTTGMTVGRARVVSIQSKKVIFAITQYGHERRDSLILGDTVTARP